MKAKRVDANQSKLVQDLRRIPGVTVKPTHTVGDGFGDIVVGYKGRNYLMEIKDPTKPPSARKLTPDEIKFHNEWLGQIDIVETLDDALIILGIKAA